MLPNYQKMFLPILQYLNDQQLHSLADIREHIVHVFAITPEEQSQRTANGYHKTLNYRLNWANTYLKKAGLITSPAHARYQISAEGKAWLAASPAEISNRLLLSKQSFREFLNK